MKPKSYRPRQGGLNRILLLALLLIGLAVVYLFVFKAPLVRPQEQLDLFESESTMENVQYEDSDAAAAAAASPPLTRQQEAMLEILKQQMAESGVRGEDDDGEGGNAAQRAEMLKQLRMQMGG